MSTAETVYALTIAQIRAAIQTIAGETETVVVPAHMDDQHQMVERQVGRRRHPEADRMIAVLGSAAERLVLERPAGMAIPMAKDVQRLAAQVGESSSTTGKRSV